MNPFRSTLLASLLMLAPLTAIAEENSPFQVAVQRTSSMISDPAATKAAQSHGLQILNLTWEDTGRFKNSSVGPNISDLTLQVEVPNHNSKGKKLVCMPVIRFPNFSDKTADLKLENFNLLVGNESGNGLEKVNLREYLGHFRQYLHTPKSWAGQNESLLSKDDSHVLVSAQACFLPIPKQEKAQFTPVLFNYQSVKDDPAVLSIVVTREGSSATIIDNHRDTFNDGGAWGQRLFFNQDGERAPFSGQRLSDFQASNDGKPNSAGVEVAQQKGLNMVLLVQVPLKQKHPQARMECMDCAPATMAGAKCESFERSSVEAAVVSHGEVEGPYTEVDNLAIERDERFPIRVTVQFYKATDNGVVSGKDLADIAAQINTVYANADYVGSLVTEGETGRPTEHSGEKKEPKDWWDDFWKRHDANKQSYFAKPVGALWRLLGWS